MGSQKKEERAGQRRRSRVKAGKKTNRQIKAGIRGRAWQNQEAGRKTELGFEEVKEKDRRGEVLGGRGAGEAEG